MKHEWKKQERAFYAPKAQPAFIDVPSFNFFTIRGEGHPDSDDFQRCIEALYSASYAVRMSHKTQHKPDDYFEYTVYPLEGVWSLIDPAKGSLDKHNFKYTLMIRQPTFLTVEQAAFFLEFALNKKKLAALSRVSFENIAEGPCVQMLHTGPFDDEPASFKRIEMYCDDEGLQRLSKDHREIYLSDFRKTQPEKLKTILRVKVGSSD